MSIGRWVLRERQGAGGMGVVYSAYDPELDRQIAIKFVACDGKTESERSQRTARVLREAQSMARLSHPNVVAVYDVGSAPPGIYIAMEYVDGTTLTKWLATRRRSVDEILRVFSEAGRGLQAAHRAGLIHRDFKPDNVMVDCSGRVRVLDFGLARPARDGETDEHGLGGLESSSPGYLDLDLTATGTAVGTPRYMAPEQYSGQAVDHRSDIYAFCVSLWEAVYEAKAFAASSYRELASQIAKGEVQQPGRRRHIPRWLRRALRRGMAPDPAQRFAEMGELLSVLECGRGRSRRWLVAAVASLALFAAGGQMLERHRQRQICIAESEGASGWWNATRKAQIADVFAQHSQPYVAHTWETFGRRLDEYALALRDTRSEACEAARVTKIQSADTYQRRARCLDRYQQRASAFVDSLMAVDGATASAGMRAVEVLPPVSDCSDDRLLAFEPDAPEDPEVAAAVAAIELELASIEGIGLGAGLASLLERNLPLVEKSRQTGYRPVIARVLLQRGTLLDDSGQAVPAREALVEALGHAEYVGDDLLRASINIVLITLDGSKRHEFDAAEVHVGHAKAVLERLGAAPRLQATFYRAVGSLRIAQERFAEAVEALESGIETARQLPTYPQLRLSLMDYRTRALLGEERYEDAQRSIEEAHEIVANELGEQHPEEGILLVMEARLKAQQGDADGSLTLLMRARDIFVAAVGPYHPNVGAVYNGIAMQLDSLGRSAEAVDAYKKAVDVIEHVQGPEALALTTALQNMAIAELGLGQGQAALGHMLRAVGIREAEYGRVHAAVASSYDILGDAYAATDQYDAAKRAYEDAIDIYARLRDGGAQAYGYAGLAELDFAAGRYSESMKAARLAVERAEGDESSLGRGRGYLVLAKATLATHGGRAKAMELLALAQGDLEGRGQEGTQRWREAQGWIAEHKPGSRM